MVATASLEFKDFFFFNKFGQWKGNEVKHISKKYAIFSHIAHYIVTLYASNVW